MIVPVIESTQVWGDVEFGGFSYSLGTPVLLSEFLKAICLSPLPLLQGLQLHITSGKMRVIS